MVPAFEKCPGCEALLPTADGPTHRYIGASPACWALYTALNGAGEPALAPGPMNVMLVDAYAAQHPGTPSDQSIQSVAVHLLALYGMLARGVAPERAVWLRQRALRQQTQPKHGRYPWLRPPSFAGSVTIADIVRAPDPEVRTALVKDYVTAVWALWSKLYLDTVAEWYERFVLPEKL